MADAGLTALIIDDEPHIVRAVRNTLADDFTRVLEAGTAQEGVDQAKEYSKPGRHSGAGLLASGVRSRGRAAPSCQ